MVDTRRDREQNMIPVKQLALRGAASKEQTHKEEFSWDERHEKCSIARPSRIHGNVLSIRNVCQLLRGEAREGGEKSKSYGSAKTVEQKAITCKIKLW